jgi:hypothetical protein
MIGKTVFEGEKSIRKKILKERYGKERPIPKTATTCIFVFFTVQLITFLRLLNFFQVSYKFQY